MKKKYAPHLKFRTPYGKTPEPKPYDIQLSEKKLNETILRKKLFYLLKTNKKHSLELDSSKIISYLDAVIDEYCEKLKSLLRNSRNQERDYVRRCLSDYKEYQTLLADIEMEISEVESRLETTKEIYDKYNPIKLGISKVKGYRNPSMVPSDGIEDEEENSDE